MINESAQNDLPGFLFRQGTNYHAYEFFGCHFDRMGQRAVFRVWAPHATEISVVGDWNAWADDAHPMKKMSEHGMWGAVVDGVKLSEKYKYSVLGQDGVRRLKADPFAFQAETGGKAASIVCDIEGHEWRDEAWMRARRRRYLADGPLNIYEAHAGSWRRHPDGGMLSQAELADELVPYLGEMGYTHLELLPIMEHHSGRTWGYRTSGFFAASSRYGAPGGLMALIDRCHEAGIGVILDWAPASFPNDEPGLAMYDGTQLYEAQGTRHSERREWGTSQFDYGRPEVQSFLISSAMFWLEVYHADGLRVDGVSSMLWPDSGKAPGDRSPDVGGGSENENEAAAAFLQRLNIEVSQNVAGATMIAEDNASWPMVTKPVHEGGLGFQLAWNTKWTGDMLEYISVDPIYRKIVHDKITSSMYFAFNEDYILSLPHGSVARGSRSLIDKMPGEYEWKFAGVRAFLGFMAAHPGKKLHFMGGEIGQFSEWDYRSALEWPLLDYPAHKQLHDYVKALNRLYLETPALWENDRSWDGFQWISSDDSEQNIVVFLRTGKSNNSLVVLQNFAPVMRAEYRFGIPKDGAYEEAFNSDRAEFGGWGHENGVLYAEETPMHGFSHSLRAVVPPLATVFFRRRT
jgi:1,4-alpha-glucan branching enzyme